MTLESLVINFTNAIETAKDNNEQGRFFIKFPAGQCGHTSDMLSQYLIDNGYGPITYVNGTYYGGSWEDIYSHTWLVVENKIIDITGDQFKYHNMPLTNDVPIYIGAMTDFYRLFEVDHRNKHEHFGIDRKWINYSELMDRYNIIKKYL